MSKPREYWIKGLTVYQSEPANIGKTLHVIEKSAYLELAKALSYKCMCWESDSVLAVRNPCHACRLLIKHGLFNSYESRKARLAAEVQSAPEGNGT